MDFFARFLFHRIKTQQKISFLKKFFFEKKIQLMLLIRRLINVNSLLIVSKKSPKINCWFKKKNLADKRKQWSVWYSKNRYWFFTVSQPKCCKRLFCLYSSKRSVQILFWKKLILIICFSLTFSNSRIHAVKIIQPSFNENFD